MEKKYSKKGPLILALASLIWGTAFVAQSVGMDYIKPFTFLAARSYVGSFVLLPLIFILSRKKPSESKSDASAKERRIPSWIEGGAVCGTVLFAASACQQIGIQYTTAGEAGFLTALYIIIVPVLGIFVKRNPGVKVWLAVAVSLMGAYLLSVKDGFSFSKGAGWLLAGSLLFSFQILACDKYGAITDPVKLSSAQFLVCGIISTLFMFIAETPTWQAVLSAAVPILYCGIFSSGVAYTLQIVGQKYTEPTVASLTMSLESVFSALAGWVILHEVLSGKELLGCALVFIAVVLAQLPNKKRKI